MGSTAAWNFSPNLSSRPVNSWIDNCRLPRGPAAVLAALHLRDPRPEALTRLTDSEWRAALDFGDRSRLTLELRATAREAMPPWVRERTDRDAEKNLKRIATIEDAYRALAFSVASAGAEFVAIKGITHAALFGLRRETRPQYDIDLFSPREQVHAASDALCDLGYEPVRSLESFPTDHLPVLVRKTGWQWRGDYFDPDMPLSVDLHFQFWNEPLEHLPAPGTDEFWTRRTTLRIAGFELPALDPADALGYAALHALRHLLRGSLSPNHVYEIASMLDTLSEDERFWEHWRRLHPPQLRQLEAVLFRLAAEWFGPRLAEAVTEEIGRLSPAIQVWFDEFAASPACVPFDSNKNELWLHCSLAPSRRAAWSIAARRLLPRNLPPRATAMYVPDAQMSWRRRLRGLLGYITYTTARLRHHLAALPKTASSGVRWWWKTNHA